MRKRTWTASGIKAAAKSKVVVKVKNTIDMKIGRFYVKHPALAIILAFIGIPVITSVIIGGVTILVIYPLATIVL